MSLRQLQSPRRLPEECRPRPPALPPEDDVPSTPPYLKEPPTAFPPDSTPLVVPGREGETVPGDVWEGADLDFPLWLGDEGL